METITAQDCQLCKRKVLSGKMIESFHSGGYVCEECCVDLAYGKLVVIDHACAAEEEE